MSRRFWSSLAREPLPPDLEVADQDQSLLSPARNTGNTGATVRDASYGPPADEAVHFAPKPLLPPRKPPSWIRRHACILIGVLLGALAAAALIALRIEVPDSAERVLHAVSCPACLALLVPPQALARAGPSSFTELVVGFCIEYKVSTRARVCLERSLTRHVGAQIQDEVVCEGAVRSQAPILAEVLSRISTGSDAARRICSTLVEACPAQPIRAITLNFTEPPIATNAANVAINGSRRVEKRWNRTGREPFLVVHISDVHIDRQYQARSSRPETRRGHTDSLLPRTQVNSSTECDKPMCCRNYGPESVGPQVGYKAGPVSW